MSGDHRGERRHAGREGHRSHQRERDDDDDWGRGRAVREYLEALA